MGFLFLVGHSRAASFLRLLPPPHTQLTHTHTTCPHTTYYLLTQLAHTQLPHTQLGTWRHRPSLCLAGVELGDIDVHSAWQAWHLWHWAGSGGVLVPRLAPCRCSCLCGRRGTWRHRLGDIDLHTQLCHTQLFHTQHFYIHKLTHTRQEWIL